ncbi:hypothetical protein [Deinococcus yavapaiensis]|uniref:Uncharacterized protein n=1 Tax=Deinococcus yavapaiensis KR-236 TaxID=694435 RepID=A0A318S9E7_9DEIO|nr:hypothetical protein [Deinococcus yavapaiensis]PYE55841.1 hypothetical protein DES52_102207 [Deinococcus yavapaiensis KR-236]
MTKSVFRSLLALASLSLSVGTLAQSNQANTSGLTISSTAATVTGGKVNVSATVRNTTSTSQTLSLGRNNFQECAFAPHVRVLRVGTRDVVYPRAEPRICTQELRAETLAANGEFKFERDLNLEPGEYVVEVWVKGFANDAPVFLSGQPVRVNVGGSASTASGSTTSSTTTSTPAANTPSVARNFTLTARAPSVATAGRSFNVVLTLTNKSASAQRVGTKLCPVGIEARSASGEQLDLQNIAATLCVADAPTTTLQAGQSRLYSVSVPAIEAAATYTLTFTTYDAGTATATVDVR